MQDFYISSSFYFSIWYHVYSLFFNDVLRLAFVELRSWMNLQMIKIKLLGPIFLANIVLIFFHTNQSIYTSRIGLLSKVEPFEVNKNNFWLGTQTNPKQMHNGREKKNLLDLSSCLYSQHFIHRLWTRQTSMI